MGRGALEGGSGSACRARGWHARLGTRSRDETCTLYTTMENVSLATQSHAIRFLKGMRPLFYAEPPSQSCFQKVEDVPDYVNKVRSGINYKNTIAYLWPALAPIDRVTILKSCRLR